MNANSIIDELYRLLSDYKIGCSVKRDEAQKRRFEEAIEAAVKAVKAEPAETDSHLSSDEVIHVDEATLKKRTGRFVVYDAEWLKNNFNTEAKLYLDSCSDTISREAVLKAISKQGKFSINFIGRIVPYQEGLIAYMRYDDIVRCIENIPDATAEDEIGKQSLLDNNIHDDV